MSVSGYSPHGKYVFESFGVKIGIQCNSGEILKKIIKNLPEIIPQECFREINEETDHNFFVECKEGKFTFRKNDDKPNEPSENEELFLRYFLKIVRLTVAEFAVGKVFLHSGAVGWKGKAIILPGDSFSGKTTLTAELLKNGATYYSDEYAVLDADGNLHPYPKTVSMRGVIDEYQQVEYAPEHYTNKIGKKAIPVSAVFLLKFEKDAVWRPRILSAGKGILAMLEHAVPMRFNPKFTLEVLNKVANRAIIAKSKRGDAEKIADLLLEFVETKAI